MIVVSYGGGTNSTAMLVGMRERNISPDLILFADTAGEKPHTYSHILDMQKWLDMVNFPQITILKATGKTLEQDCLDRNALPSVAYGFKTCSQRWKLAPQEKYLNQIGAVDYEKWIGFDADEPHRAKPYPNNRYPLIEWGWGRDECVEAIKSAGLPLPGKSACFFCPSSKVQEIKWLARTHPELAARAVAMEENALSEIRKCSNCDGTGIVYKKLIYVESVFTEQDKEERKGLDEDDYSENEQMWSFDVGDVYVTKEFVDAPEGVECHLCFGSGKLEPTVKGLGRSFSWKEVIEYDKAQIDFFDESRIQIDCGCYDGE